MKTCIFCLKICHGFDNRTPLNENDSIFASKTEPPDIKNEVLERFFNFLERYLSDDGSDKPNSSKKSSLFGKLKERRACEDCLKSVKAFCDLYHDLETIQLLLNWQLCTLKDIMITAKRSSPEQDKADDVDNSFRTELIKNVSQKLISSYPRLILKKLPRPDGRRERLTETGVDNLQISSVQESHSFLNAPSPQKTAIQNLSSSSSFTVPIKRDTSHSLKSKTRKMIAKKRLPIQRSYQKYVKKSTKFIQNLGKRSYKRNVPSLIETDDSALSAPLKDSAIKTEKEDVIPPRAEELEDDAGISNSPEPHEKNAIKPAGRILRTAYKCSSCSKTFSTSERLSVHKKMANCGDNCVDESLDEVGSEVEDDFEVKDTSSDDSVEKDVKTVKNTERKKKSINHGTSPRRMKLKKIKCKKLAKCPFCGKSLSTMKYLRNHVLNTHPHKWEFAKQSCFRKRQMKCRLKCPDAKCSDLFKETVSLLLHWRSVHQKPSDENELIVQLLSFTVDPDTKYFKILDISLQKPKQIAKILLTPLKPEIEVVFCPEENCRSKEFFSKEGFQAHMKLHGKFTCSVCPVVEDFLPDLALHEVRVHNGTESSNARVLKCLRCKETFERKTAYIRHFALEHFSTEFKEESCPICKAYFSNFEEGRNGSVLFKHFEKCHNLEDQQSGRLVCDEGSCSAYFFDPRLLSWHKKMKHPGRTLALPKKSIQNQRLLCNHCRRSFKTRHILRSHILLEHPEKWESTKYKKTNKFKFKCPDCEKVFSQVHFLLLHWKKDHSKMLTSKSKLDVDILTFSVDPDSKFFQRLDLDVRKPKHFAKIEIPPLEGDRELKICQIETCQRPFYTNEDFEAHKNMHGSFTCALCPVTKEFLPELAAHEAHAHVPHGEDRRWVNCRRCKLRFNEFQGFLRHHVTVHFSLKFAEQSCSICTYYLPKYERKRSAGSAFLFNHFKEFHDLAGKKGRGVHTCGEFGCSAYFLSLNTLTSHHRREHNMDKEKLDSLKKCVCEECGKVFNDKVKFQMHLLSHSGPSSWQFVCEICSRKCMTKGKLKEHMRTHTKEKPFVCQVCGAAYGHRHNLRIHVNSKHGDVVQDVAKKVDKPNLTSRKGVKRNPEMAGVDKSVRNKRKRRKKAG